MSIESTRNVSREDAENWVLDELGKRWAKENRAKVLNLSDKELEDELYCLTRETNYFDNFHINPN